MANTAPASNGAPPGKKHGLRHRLLDEARRFVILFLYLWILFGLFVLNEAVVLRQGGGSFAPQGFALVNALVLAKVMLVFEDLNLARWMKHRPLIQTILFEAALCTLLFLAFHVIERVAVDLFQGREITGADLAFGGGGFAGLAIVTVILFVSLFPFFAFKNVTRAIGWDRMKQILFHPPAPVE